jgi:predicted dehydrogenase
MFELSRRDFLKGSALLAASAAAVGLDQTITHAPVQAQPPGGAGERLNIAVIGVNGRGMDHIRGLAGHHNCRITHICDVDSAVVQRAVNAVQNAQGGAAPAVVTDMRRLFENRDIHAVTVATPNHWHSLAAIWALQAGKHVYCEKPVSHNVFEGRRLVEIREQANKVCQTGTQIRSSSGSRAAIEFLHGGNLGEVRVARALCYKPRGTIGRHTGEVPIPASVDYNLWCGPAPRRPLNRNRLHYDWHWQWDYGNGDLGNQGIHQMDVARWGLNKNELCRAVVSVGGRFGYVDDGETANTQICWFDFGDKQLIFEVRGLRTPAKRGASVGNIFHCANGYLVFPSYNAAVAYDLDGRVIRRFNGPDDHYANFCAAVRSNRQQDLNAPILQGHLSSALCHLGNISYRLGRPQPFEPRQVVFTDSANAQNTMVVMEEHLQENGVPMGTTNLIVGRRLVVHPTNENFPHDDEANGMLTRQYREGFVVPRA